MDEQQATPLIGEYVLEDFYTEKPYLAIFNENNRFLQNMMLQRTRDLAARLGFKGFMTAWKAYLSSQIKAQEPQIAGENETTFDGQPQVLRCGTYVCSGSRVTRLNEYGQEVEVISHPIMPTKRVTNIETGEAKTEIAFQRGREPWKHITVPRDVLASSQRIVALARQDVAVNSENAREVVRYLSDIESRNYDELPKQCAVAHMGWLPDGQFMPYAEGITYDSDNPEFERIYNELRPTGDEQVWMDIATETRRGASVPARIALAAAFAAPLVKLLSALPFFVHLWGAKGCAKTVGMMLGASVWGNPELGGFTKTFSGTKVSFELHSAFCCNLPVCLDELQVIDNNKQNFDDIIYMLCEGANKGRGTKGGGLQLQRRWSTCVITTGETPIIRSNSGGGAAVRTIEVNYNGQPLFGTDERARDVAIALKKNYGHAGKRYVEFLQRDTTRAVMDQLFRKYSAELAGNVDGKQVISAAVLLTADALADLAVFHDGNSLTASELKRYLTTKQESDVDRRAYSWLMDTVAANNYKFEPTADNYTGEIWGRFVEDGDSTTVCINRSRFSELLRSAGYNDRSFCAWAKSAGVLETGSDGKSTKPVRLSSMNSKLTRCYCLKMIDLDAQKAPDKFEQVDVKEEDLPW